MRFDELGREIRKELMDVRYAVCDVEDFAVVPDDLAVARTSRSACSSGSNTVSETSRESCPCGNRELSRHSRSAA